MVSLVGHASLKGRDPYVVFSPILAAPRAVDSEPAEIFAWQSARGIDEHEWEPYFGDGRVA
jgi:hypothetical protein